jgi:hypothetical protein
MRPHRSAPATVDGIFPVKPIAQFPPQLSQIDRLLLMVAETP